MKTNKFQDIAFRLAGDSHLKNVEIIKASEAIDIHKIHHRSKQEFHKYVEQFNVDRDTLFVYRSRAVLVTSRPSGRIMFSGQWRQDYFTPLVAYCDLQGVQKDFFLVVNEGLSGVERQHRDSLVRGLYCELEFVRSAIQSYFQGDFPLSSGCALDIVTSRGKLEPREESATIQLRDLQGYYKIWDSVTRVISLAPLEEVLAEVPNRVLGLAVTSRLGQTKASKRVSFFQQLRGGISDDRPNNTITSWDDDGTIQFSSGVSQKIPKDKARAYLGGKLATLSTSYGPIRSEGDLLICGCHRVGLAEAREVLGMPYVGPQKEAALPPFLAKVKADYEAAQLAGQEAVTAAERHATAARGCYDDHVASEGPATPEGDRLAELHQAAHTLLYSRRREQRGRALAAVNAMRDRLNLAYRNTREKLERLLKGSDEVEVLIQTNRVAVAEERAEAEVSNLAVGKRAEVLADHRMWLDYVSFNAKGHLLMTK